MVVERLITLICCYGWVLVIYVHTFGLTIRFGYGYGRSVYHLRYIFACLVPVLGYGSGSIYPGPALVRLLRRWCGGCGCGCTAHVYTRLPVCSPDIWTVLLLRLPCFIYYTTYTVVGWLRSG